jgi:hypothetical protein
MSIYLMRIEELTLYFLCKLLDAKAQAIDAGMIP